MLVACVWVLAVTLAECSAAWGGGRGERGAPGDLWAIQLVSADRNIAESVATDLGMIIVGRVFDNVFLMRETNSSVGKPRHKNINHTLIVWSEQQKGYRRSSGNNRIITETKSKIDKYNDNKQTHSRRKTRNIGVLDREPPESPWTTLKILDPLRWRQWYLERGDGVYLNVTGLWEAGVRGAGVSVAILDDGVELSHLDLALNYDPAASWDFLDADPDPTPVSLSRHGTQLAGIIAATHSNGLCGMGVAPWTGVGAIRMLSYMVWDVTEAAALSYERNHVDVYVAAWGPVDTGTVMEGPGVLAAKAIRESIALGRGGRGSIYVWASGNGGFVGDDCNADGYANSVYTLTVSGSTHGGRPPDYTETCAASFVSTYSGDVDEEEEEEFNTEEQVRGIVTTDTGGECTESFRGSSVSAAMVAGVCALALGVNPKLRWRDMQHLMVQSATPHNPIPSQWNSNGVGLNYSYHFGFGSLDAGHLVDKARNWQPVPQAFRCYMHAQHQNISLIPDVPLVLPLSVSGCQVVQLEHVQVNLSVSARNRGQVEVKLESPSGTMSTLLPRRPLDLSPYGIHNHPLLTVHMWGENPQGSWKLHLIYHNESILGPFGIKPLINITNVLHNWTLVLHGTEVPISEASPQHYYYNSTQLSRMHRRKNIRRTVVLPNRRAKNPENSLNDAVRIEVKHWHSKPEVGKMLFSYLFCRLYNANLNEVDYLNWYTSDEKAIDNVIRRIRGRNIHSRHSAILLIRKIQAVSGNFTCTASYNGEVFIKSIEIKGPHSSIPMNTDITRVSVLDDMIKLTCDALTPLVRGVWSHEGQRLNSSTRIVINEEDLTILNVRKEDLGKYKCHLRSPRLHLSHTLSITLLSAAGPTTLIRHYNLVPSPNIPQTVPTATPCTNVNTTTLPVSPETSEEVEAKYCPSPYQMIEGHCCHVSLGGMRSWYRSRSHCQRMRGDLLVVKDETFLLALMRHFHEKDLSSSSFWVGGVRRDEGEWRWVDGSPLSPQGLLWYPTTQGAPRQAQPSHRLNHFKRERHTGFPRAIQSRNNRRPPPPPSSVFPSASPRQQQQQQQQSGQDIRTSALNQTHLSHPPRAVCLLPRFRHFFVSCSVAERFTAICEFNSNL